MAVFRTTRTALTPSLQRSLPDRRLGYGALTDAVPLLVADAKEFFKRHGVQATLPPAADPAVPLRAPRQCANVGFGNPADGNVGCGRRIWAVRPAV